VPIRGQLLHAKGDTVQGLQPIQGGVGHSSNFYLSPYEFSLQYGISGAAGTGGVLRTVNGTSTNRGFTMPWDCTLVWNSCTNQDSPVNVSGDLVIWVNGFSTYTIPGAFGTPLPVPYANITLGWDFSAGDAVSFRLGTVVGGTISNLNATAGFRRRF